MIAIEQEHLVTLVAATAVCNLMEMAQLVPHNSRVAGQIRRIHESITNIAAMHGGKLDDGWITIGVNASNAGMKVIQKAITAEAKRVKAEGKQ